MIEVFTFNGDEKRFACGRRNTVVSLALKHVVGVTCYVAEYQLVTDADHSTLSVVVCRHRHIIIIIIIIGIISNSSYL